MRLSLISAAAFRASVVVPYIRLRAITGRFFQKRLFTESLTIGTQGDYFAEDYTFGGYTAASFSIEARKPVAEAVGITDLFDVVSNKQPSETVDLVETVVRGTISSIIDTPTVSDSGALQMQDYCALDYFAQDYVGTSLTF